MKETSRSTARPGFKENYPMVKLVKDKLYVESSIEQYKTRSAVLAKKDLVQAETRIKRLLKGARKRTKH
jgi:hypothetical protein